MSIPLRRSIKIIRVALDESKRDWEYRRYLVLLPNMNEKNYVSFAEFYEQTKPVKVDARPKDDIMIEILKG
jgi:hypothetical protein